MNVDNITIKQNVLKKMSDQVYVLIYEDGEYSDYHMRVSGVFSSLESSVHGLLLAMTKTTTEEECLSSVVNMLKERDLNYECFSIIKTTLGDMIDENDKWRYSLIPKKLIGSSPYTYQCTKFSAPKGFYLVRTKRMYGGPMSCQKPISMKKDEYVCRMCNDHDDEFSFSLGFLDRFNEVWIKRFITK